jgi:hypothetical protein
MFLGDANDAREILRWLVDDAVAQGAKGVGVEVERDGTLVFSEDGARNSAERRAEWLACQTDPETAIVHTLALHIASFASSSFKVEWSAPTMHVRLCPEPARFRSSATSFFAVVGYLRDQATARPDLKIELRDHASGAHVSLAYPEGALDRLREEAGFRSFNHRPMRFVATTDGGALDVAFSWTHGPGLQVVALVNGERTPSGGSHVKGVWEGIARALETRMQKVPTRGPRRTVVEADLPRNAVLVTSVHLKDPSWGPATRDCLHHDRTADVIADRVASDFLAQLGPAALANAWPPWQCLGDVHRTEHWLELMAAGLQEPAGPPPVDPFIHRAGEE